MDLTAKNTIIGLIGIGAGILIISSLYISTYFNSDGGGSIKTSEGRIGDTFITAHNNGFDEFKEDVHDQDKTKAAANKNQSVNNDEAEKLTGNTAEVPKETGGTGNPVKTESNESKSNTSDKKATDAESKSSPAAASNNSSVATTTTSSDSTNASTKASTDSTNATAKASTDSTNATAKASTDTTVSSSTGTSSGSTASSSGPVTVPSNGTAIDSGKTNSVASGDENTNTVTSGSSSGTGPIDKFESKEEPMESLKKKNIKSSSTETVNVTPIPDGLIHVKKIEEKICGGKNNNSTMFCGVYELELNYPIATKYRIFYVDGSEKSVEKIIKSLEGIKMTKDFRLKKYFRPSVSYTEDGKTYYLKEITDKDNDQIGPSAEKVLKHVKKSGFLGFYNDLEGTDWNHEEIFFIAPGPDLENMKLFNADEKNFELKGNGEPPVDELLIEKPITKTGYLGYYKYYYKIRVREITNIFRNTGLKALHIEFMDQKSENQAIENRESEFISYKNFSEANAIDRHTAYDGLNVYYNFKQTNADIIEALDSIKVNGVETEFERQYSKLGVLSSFSSFSVLLVGSSDKLKPFEEIIKKNKNI